MGSPDLEDMIAVFDGRPSLSVEISEAQPGLRRFVASGLATLLETPAFLEALPGHLMAEAGGADRAAIVLRRMEEVAGNR